MQTLSDMGENYEYAKTIVRNKISLVKLEAIEKGGALLGTFITLLIVGMICSVILLTTLGLLTYWLAIAINSFPVAILIFIIILSVLSLMIFFWREQVIIRPLTKLIYHKTK